MATTLAVLVSLQLLTFLPDDVHSQETITCHAGTGYIGHPSNITCNFHRDVRTERTAVSVVMIPFTLRRDEEEREVLQCSWSEGTDKPLCLVTPDYTFNYDVTQRLTVAIPYTTRGYAGLYSCHVVPPDGATVENCEFIVTEKILKKEGTTSMFSPSKLPMVSRESRSAMDLAMLILIILVVLLLIPVFIISLCHAWKKKWISDCISTVSNSLQSKRKKEESDQENPPSECTDPAPYAKVSRKPRKTDYDEIPDDSFKPLLSTSTPTKAETPSQMNDQPRTFRATASLNLSPPGSVTWSGPGQNQLSREDEGMERSNGEGLTETNLPAAPTAERCGSAASSDLARIQPAHTGEDKDAGTEANPTNQIRSPGYAGQTTTDQPASAASSDPARVQAAHTREEKGVGTEANPPNQNRSSRDTVETAANQPASTACSDTDRKRSEDGGKSVLNRFLKSYPAPPPPSERATK